MYTELLFKAAHGNSLFFQNLQLYAYGAAVLGVTLAATEGPQLYQEGLLHGWRASTWLVAASSAAFGLCCAFVFRYLDNMLYVIASVACIFVSAAADGLLYNRPPEWVLLPAAALVLLGVRLYYFPPAWATPASAAPAYSPVPAVAEAPTAAAPAQQQPTTAAGAVATARANATQLREEPDPSTEMGGGRI